MSTATIRLRGPRFEIEANDFETVRELWFALPRVFKLSEREAALEAKCADIQRNADMTADANATLTRRVGSLEWYKRAYQSQPKPSLDESVVSVIDGLEAVAPDTANGDIARCVRCLGNVRQVLLSREADPMPTVTRAMLIAGLEAEGFKLKPHAKPPNLVKLASDMTQMLWDAEGGDLDNEAVQGLLVSCGVVLYRKPTEAELKDPEWWGHEWEIGPDDESVGEYTHDMKELRKAAKAAETA